MKRSRLVIEVAKRECWACRKEVEVREIFDSLASHRWTETPPGWFADLGHADSGALVCSLKCAQAKHNGTYNALRPR